MAIIAHTATPWVLLFFITGAHAPDFVSFSAVSSAAFCIDDDALAHAVALAQKHVASASVSDPALLDGLMVAWHAPNDGRRRVGDGDGGDHERHRQQR